MLKHHTLCRKSNHCGSCSCMQSKHLIVLYLTDPSPQYCASQSHNSVWSSQSHISVSSPQCCASQSHPHSFLSASLKSLSIVSHRPLSHSLVSHSHLCPCSRISSSRTFLLSIPIKHEFFWNILMIFKTI